MPMIPVRHHNGAPNNDSINLLREMLEKRFVLKDVLTQPEETSCKFILASGGHIRDLVRMLRDACVESTDKIDIDVAQKMINRLGEDYKRMIRDHQYKNLIETHKTKDITNNEDTHSLIYNTIILVYQNPDGCEWYDIHPALANTNKFQRLLN